MGFTGSTFSQYFKEQTNYENRKYFYCIYGLEFGNLSFKDQKFGYLKINLNTIITITF